MVQIRLEALKDNKTEEDIEAKPDSSHEQAQHQDYFLSVPMVGATQVWCTNKDDLSQSASSKAGATPTQVSVPIKM